jgi:hypothetical protein
MVTPVQIQSVLQTSWIEFIDCNENIKRVVGQEFGDSITLSSPISHNRAILYPGADYFIIVDRFSSAEPWIYDSIFRPTSLTTTPSRGSSDEIVESDVGHVNGELSIDNKKFNWQSLPYSTETDTGITSDSITWTTTNPYGKNVEMKLISEPPSRIKITKLVGRIGGYDYRSEVFSPDIWLNTPASQDLSRITVLLSRYTDEEKKTTEKIPVQGSGTAIKVHSSHSDDTIYAGYGKSTLNNFSTDAEIVFIRQSGDSSEITLLDGTFLNYETTPWISMSKKADYVTVTKNGNIIDYKIQGDPGISGTIFSDPVTPDKIQESASINEQQKPVAIKSFPELLSGDLFDPISWIKNFAKKIFSFFNL